ncbi:MAG: adenylosuccinate lyase [Candidatus Daviesbacteria bacterium]|nr:adenylosuccinate lyase [Candidatus Daviesbacteria bacterium]
MPLPERYAQEVADVVAIWLPEGYFRAQTQIWNAELKAAYQLDGLPTLEQLARIRQALILSPEDIAALNIAKGHETNKLLRRVQSKLPTEDGNYVHRGNTSSDVLDTSLSLQIRSSIDIAQGDFAKLGANLQKFALQHRDTLQVGRSHGIHALPHTFGRQVAGWYSDVREGVTIFDKARDAISYGKLSGEVGTHVFIRPELEELALSQLGLKPDPAPSQVISRVRHAQVASLMAVNGGILERIATNVRLLSMTDVGEVREPFDPREQQGSSAMPHKRNPELSERICGLARLIRGNALAQLESMALWFERDISHSSVERSTFQDIFGNLSYAARLATHVIGGLVVYTDRMSENMGKTYGGIYSSRLLNELLPRGLARTDAYELVKGLSQRALDTRTDLQALASRDPKIREFLTTEELAEVFQPGYYLRNIDVAFKRLGILEE